MERDIMLVSIIVIGPFENGDIKLISAQIALRSER